MGMSCASWRHPLRGEQPGEKFIEIFAKRQLHLAEDSSLQKLLEIDGIEEVLEACDKKTIESMREQAQRSEEGASEFAAQVAEYRKANSKATAASRRAQVDAFRGKAFPKRLPQFNSSLTKAHFDSLLPPGYRSHPEAFHGRWRIYCRDPLRSRSMSWELHGYESSAKLLLADAWAEFSGRTGAECPFSQDLASNAAEAKPSAG